MKDNKNYDYTDEFSSMVHSARFINAAELSGLFFSCLLYTSPSPRD